MGRGYDDNKQLLTKEFPDDQPKPNKSSEDTMDKN